jgi:hypothetical protein
MPYLILPRNVDFSQAVCPLSWSDTLYDAGFWHLISTQSIGYQPILFSATAVPANRLGCTRPANVRKETQRLSSVRGKFRTSVRPQAAYAYSQRAERVCLLSVQEGPGKKRFIAKTSGYMQGPALTLTTQGHLSGQAPGSVTAPLVISSGIHTPL